MRIQFKSYFLASAIILGQALIGSTAYANSLGVEPLFLEISPTQSAAVRVRNTSEDSVPVEVFVYRRDVDENGKQTRVPADDDFIIFPPQATVKTGATQVFRLRPVKPEAATSTSYYVAFSQVPKAMTPRNSDGSAQVQVVFAFDAAVHVVPRKARGKFDIESTELSSTTIRQATGEKEKDETGQIVDVIKPIDVAAAKVKIVNSGNKYLYLHDQRFVADITDMTGEISTHEWSSDDIAKAVRTTLVEPQEARIFTLPLPAGIRVATVDVRMKKQTGL